MRYFLFAENKFNKIGLGVLAFSSMIVLLNAISLVYANQKNGNPRIFSEATACIDAPTQEHCTSKNTMVYPWFDKYPNFTNGEMGEIPESIKKILSSLPNEKAILPQGLRTEYIKEEARILAIPGYGTIPDYLVFQEDYGDSDETRYHFWIRSFEGKDPLDTVYLISIATYCDFIEDYFKRHPESTETRSSSCEPTKMGEVNFDLSMEESWDVERKYQSQRARSSSIRAYQVDKNNKIYDVTSEVLPPLSSLAISNEVLQKYWKHGFYGVFLDDSQLEKVPVFRWMAGLDPNEPMADKDVRLTATGDRIHFGYVVWNGKKFEFYERVSRSLWPCFESSSGEPICEDDFVIVP